MSPEDESKEIPEVENNNEEMEIIEEEEVEGEVALEEEEAMPEQLPPPAQQMLTTSEERNWAMLSHLSILLNLFTGFLGPVVSLVIYLVYRDRSRYVAYQSLQATIFQLITWIGAGLLIGGIWLVTLVLSAILVGLLCLPFSLIGTLLLLVAPLASLIYGVYAAVKCSDGEDFRYWLVGDWVRVTYEQG
jgi:uncharacterized Tic20 family protein